MTDALTQINHLDIWLTAFFTLALFSFLYKDNPFYKLAEHIFAGLSAGYYFGLYFKSSIWDKLVDPLYVDFWGNLPVLIPAMLGMMMLTRLTPFWRIPDISWMSRWGLALTVGTTAGIFLTSRLHGRVMPQVLATFKYFDGSGGDGGVMWLFLGLLSFVGVVSTLIYFYFSFSHKGAIGGIARVGIWFIMVSFGAQFGYTVMARISLLIGRTSFLIDDWLVGSIGSIFS